MLDNLDILLIEDDDQVRKLLCMILTRGGYNVIEARNGEEGVRKYYDHPYPVVITDLVMPEKEGIETIREIKNYYKQVKIIAISGGGRVTSRDYLDFAEGVGADYSFSKPVDHERLLAVLEECFQA